MLPESKSNLLDAGYTDQTAGAIVMGCFVGGFVGIQFVSRLLHRYMPSHVVDCDHTHDEPKDGAGDSKRQRRLRHHHPHDHHPSRPTVAGRASHHHGQPNGRLSETTPLLLNTTRTEEHHHARSTGNLHVDTTQTIVAKSSAKSRPQRPSIAQVQERVMSFVKDTKCNCDEGGICYGYSDPCGQECFKHVSTRIVHPSRTTPLSRPPTGTLQADAVRDGDAHPAAAAIEMPVSPGHSAASRDLPGGTSPVEEEEEEGEQEGNGKGIQSDDDVYHKGNGDVEAQHHHHVPTNAFLSLGLQTSIAIALHKFPEGFITYATNHASPTLGFSLFMAIFVHNISEGFAMALPLYMALGSRLRALAWSSILGGLSQPLGAAIAVLWFRVADGTHLSPGAVAYACMFAITAGIMVSVALQLFAEALCLDHNRNLCIFFGFLGMALLGVSNAVAGQ